MKNLIPQNLTHRGTVSAEVFLLSAKLLDEKEMRRRALELRTQDAQIFSRENDLIVRLRAPVRVDSAQSTGLPFVKYGVIFSAFPLREKDLPSLRNLGECLIFLSKGELEIVRWNELKIENVANWFDVADFQISETETLGETVAAPQLMKNVSEAEVDLRSELLDAPPADAQLADILAKLKEFKQLNENKKSGALFPNSASSSSSSAANFFASIFNSFRQLFASESSFESGGNGSAKSGANEMFSAAQTEGAWAKIYNRLRNLTVKAVIEMRLGKIFGRRQAKYLAEMMEKFERGDLSEALKYAIPLEDMDALREVMSKTTALLTPRPRTDLQITFGSNAGGSNINLEADWFARLQQLYRQSFERLEAQGRFEEAAFVLAELLKSNAEAVEFLAKHGKYRLAATLAEARNLPKETIVRQWFLAGEKTRAVRLAILHDCFEYAVNKLEQSNSPTGAELREIWAQSLANAGNFPAAVDVIWKLENKREKAQNWLEKSIEFGGIAGARMLARKTLLFPEKFAEIVEKFDEIRRDREPAGIEKRAAFARAVFKQTVNGELRTLLRPLTGKILSDAFRSSQTLSAKEFRELVTITGDHALRTDLPVYPQTLLPLAVEKCFELTVSGEDRGASVIFDACLLPDGKIVIALGEVGVKILSRAGKTIQWFDQPAQKLIVSDHSNKAIALARRGETARLARIDFVERRAAFWADAKLDVYASNYDGHTWFVGLKDEFYAIDANADKFEAVWNVPDTGATVCAAVRSKNQVRFLTLDQKGFETWNYELPNLTLRNRSRRDWLENSENALLNSAAISEGNYSTVIMQTQSEESKKPVFLASIYESDRLARRYDFPIDVIKIDQPVLSEQYLAIAAYSHKQADVYVFSGENLTALFTLEGSSGLALKFNENLLTISDNCGRLLIYDHQNRSLRQNLRV